MELSNSDEKNKFMSRVEISDTCWIWMASKNSDGYGNVWAKGKCLKAHRLSYQLFKGDIPIGKEICHSCDNPSCVNPDHLWVGTHKENMNDMVNKKRTLYGEQRKNNKIPVSLRPKLAERYKSGETMLALAKEYKCHASAIFTAIHYILPIGFDFKGENHPRSILKKKMS